MTDTSQPVPVAWADPQRKKEFERSLAPLAAEHGLNPRSLRAASADASFRRYLRIESTQGSRIIMDAPPPQEDVHPFVHVAQLIRDDVNADSNWTPFIPSLQRKLFKGERE